uniref:Uncharacterized protein n=1 Tax=Bartonella schoenbuchensis (strain DSM 13525 / NCTC 13165 / R1) TaxID=687861 RepID=E6Z0S8_BARSR|nr:hypothetical protein B11C_120001 [Bartonella schoenbuchensis R1]
MLKTLNDKRTGYETISPLSLKTDFLLYVFQRITTLSGVVHHIILFMRKV